MSLATQPDGKLLLGCYGSVFRLLLDGTVDPSFHTTVFGEVKAITVRSDGKVVAGGEFWDAPNVFIRLLDTNGGVDATFAPSLGSDCAFLLPAYGGRVYAGTDDSVWRLLPDGRPDELFNRGGSRYYSGGAGLRGQVALQLTADRGVLAADSMSGKLTVHQLDRHANFFWFWTNASSDMPSVAVLPDNDVVVGEASSPIGSRFLRLSSGGTLRSGFDLLVQPTSRAATGERIWIAAQPDGKLLIFGATNVNGIAVSNITRVLGNGALDPQFDSSNASTNRVTAVLLADTNIFFAEYNTNSGARIMRFSAGPLSAPGIVAQPTNSVLLTTNAPSLHGGTIQLSVSATSGPAPVITWWHNGVFVGEGSVLSVANAHRADEGNYLAIVSNALGVVTSSVTSVTLGLPPAYAGAVDAEFPTTAGMDANGSIWAFARQSDGKLLLGGTFNYFEGDWRPNLVRLTPEGARDASFRGAVIDSDVCDVLLETNDAFLVCGYFTNIDSAAHGRLARLSRDGELEGTWQLDADNTVFRLLRTSSGIVAAGMFTNFGGAVHRCVARFHDNAAVDPNFNAQIVGNGFIESIAEGGNGTLLIGGTFTNVNGSTRLRLARLLTNGAVDPSFAPPGISDGSVRAIALQADGAVLIGGSFTQAGATKVGKLARLLADGRLDASFATNGSGDYDVLSIEAEPGGKVMVAGDFTTFGGSARSGLVRLHADGKVDTNFICAPGVAGHLNRVRKTHIEDDGRILIIGGFTHYNGTPRGGIARVLGDLRLFAQRGGGIPSFHFPTVPGRQYAVEATESLLSKDWSSCTNFTAAATLSEVREGSTNAFRFYRARLD